MGRNNGEYEDIPSSCFVFFILTLLFFIVIVSSSFLSTMMGR